MATIVKSRSKWRAIIRTKSYSGSKTFDTREDAESWAAATEVKTPKVATSKPRRKKSLESGEFCLVGTKRDLLRERVRWQNMMRRCYQESTPSYKHYGGRGIYVCERWHKFKNYYLDMGSCPEGMSIDRIDNEGPYDPGNCRWATQKEQCNNQRARTLLSRDARAAIRLTKNESLMRIWQIEEDQIALRVGRKPLNVVHRMLQTWQAS